MEQLSSSMQEAIMAAMAEEDEYLDSSVLEGLEPDDAMNELLLQAVSEETETQAEVDPELQELMQAVAENKRLKMEIEDLKLTWEKHVERTLQKQGFALPARPTESAPSSPPPSDSGAARTSVPEKLKELREENAVLLSTHRNLKERWDATEALLLEEQAREAQRKKATESSLLNLGFSGLGFGRGPTFGSLLGRRKETHAPPPVAPAPASSEEPAPEDLEEEELPPVSMVVAEPPPKPATAPTSAGPPGFAIPTSLPVHHGPVDVLTRGFFGRSWKIYYFILYDSRVDCFYNINDAQAHIDYTGNKYGPRRKSNVGLSEHSESKRDSCSGSSSSSSDGGSSGEKSGSRRNSCSSSSSSNDNSGSENNDTNSSSGDSGEEGNARRKSVSNESENKQVNEEDVDLAFLQTSSVYLPPPEFCIILDQKGVSVRMENYQEYGVSFGRGFELTLPSATYHLCTEDVASTEKWMQVLAKAIYGDDVELESEQEQDD